MEGWISLHRKIRKNPIFNDHELLRLWLICLTEATHKERDQMVGRQTVHLMAGQFVTGRFDLETMYNSGLKREQQKSPITVWRWLEFLQTSDFLIISSNNKFSIVSIANWDKYQNGDQENDQQMINKRSTNDQQMITNNNVNNLKPLVISKKDIMYSSDYEKFYSEYPKKIEKLVGYKSWEKLIKAKEDPQLLIRCAMNYATYCKASDTAQEFIKHPATFLNKQRYKDHINPVLLQGGASQESVHKLYRRKMGEVSQEINNMISRWVEHFGEEMVRQAIEYANSTNQREAADILPILKDWKKSGMGEASNH